ncbi:MAG: RNase adapter RapZ [Thermodesulfobacteriota bacterium]
MHDLRDFPVILLSGLSGAGKSTAMKVFEDLGFIAVDGLPPDLAPGLAALFQSQQTAHHQGLVMGLDVRSEDFREDFRAAMEGLKAQGIAPRVVFIESRAGVLRRRYASTRRPHPLESGELDLERALDAERELLRPVRDAAELVVDTSDYSIHDLRRHLQERWEFVRERRAGLKIYLLSFGFKYGQPTEADLVFDLRFLPNPHFDESLRPLSGRDRAVVDYVFRTPEGQEFRTRLLEFLNYLLPLYQAEGRYRLTVAVGCTGGRHRSVAVAEAVFDSLVKSGYVVNLEHRHIELG